MSQSRKGATVGRISAGEAIRRLKADGWERIASVMSDDPARGENYGLLFARGVERFWLNKDSVNALPPALAASDGDGTSDDPEALRSAYQAAACMGRCRLFGVDAGELDGTLPTGLALAASVQWSAYLGEWIEAAGRLPRAWSETAEEVEALDRAVDLLTARTESWAVFLAVDEAYQDSVELASPAGPRLGPALRFALDSLDRFDGVLRDNAAYLAPVAGTELLNNLRSLLAPGYGRTLPWWLDGSLEDLWKRIREAAPAWLPVSLPTTRRTVR